MNTSRWLMVLGLAVVLAIASGCAAPKVDLSSIERPERPAELDAWNVFIGSWDWKAEMLNAEGNDRMWAGKADWRWTLDKRWLHGTMSTSSNGTKLEMAGVWGWNAKKKKYTWWMFNDWGYSQEGTADYDADSRSWTMDYVSVGLDGTKSYGRYGMKVVNNDTLEWSMDEWADFTRMIKKMEMTGTYKRRK